MAPDIISNKTYAIHDLPYPVSKCSAAPNVISQNVAGGNVRDARSLATAPIGSLYQLRAVQGRQLRFSSRGCFSCMTLIRSVGCFTPSDSLLRGTGYDLVSVLLYAITTAAAIRIAMAAYIW